MARNATTLFGPVCAGSVWNDLLGEAQQDRVERRDGRDRGGVDQAALDDDLDVHQPVADDGGRKRERHEAEQDRRSARTRATGSKPSANGSA